MPSQPPRPCRQCGTLLYNGADCPDHPRPKRVDNRQSASARGYGSEWRIKIRDPYIASHPWCVDPYHVHPDVQVHAQMVDHIVPKPQGTDAYDNLQSLCYRCHQIKGFRDGTHRRGGGISKSKAFDI